MLRWPYGMYILLGLLSLLFRSPLVTGREISLDRQETQAQKRVATPQTSSRRNIATRSPPKAAATRRTTKIPSSTLSRKVSATESSPSLANPVDDYEEESSKPWVPTRRVTRKTEASQLRRRRLAGNNNMDYHSVDSMQRLVTKTFDFVLAGFPNTGTSALIQQLETHPDIDMSPMEQCIAVSPTISDSRFQEALQANLQPMSADAHVRRSFQCATTLYNYRSLNGIATHNPNTKLVIGLQHPIKMMQSLYNQRVADAYEQKREGEIPSLDDIVLAGQPWMGVSLHSIRFDLFLLQLGKTFMTAEQLQEMIDQPYDLAITPNSFPVFLYTAEQLEHSTLVQTQAFRTTLQVFLGLKAPIETSSSAVTDTTPLYPESIDICDEKYSSVRKRIAQLGATMAEWIREEFLNSNDVVVADQPHFLQSMNKWGKDPCRTTTGVTAQLSY